MPPTPSLPERSLRLPELQQLVPYTRMHIDRLEKAGQFPRRLKIGPGRVVWRLSDVMAWLDAKRVDQQAA